MPESNFCIDNYLCKPYFFIPLFSCLVPPHNAPTTLGGVSDEWSSFTPFPALRTPAAFLSSSPSHSAVSVLEGTVVNVADGDTITVLDSDKVQHRVRIAGIDAPEKGQPFGNASRKRFGELVARTVRAVHIRNEGNGITLTQQRRTSTRPPMGISQDCGNRKGGLPAQSVEPYY